MLFLTYCAQLNFKNSPFSLETSKTFGLNSHIPFYTKLYSWNPIKKMSILFKKNGLNQLNVKLKKWPQNSGHHSATIVE